jgi:hypothetical protein
MKPGNDGNIHWDDTIIFNPQFGADPFGNLPQGGIPIPAYGTFGGPQNPALGEPVTEGPVDALDSLFMAHDLAILALLPGGLNPEELVSPHADLIEGIATLDQAGGLGNAEASLYAGLTTLALAGELAQHDLLDDLAAELDQYSLSTLLTEAVENMEVGLAQVGGEGKSLHGVLHYFEQHLVNPLFSSDTSDLWM